MRLMDRCSATLLLGALLATACAGKQGFFVRSSETRTVPGGAVVVLAGLTHPIGIPQDQIESSVASIEEYRALSVSLVVTMPGLSGPARPLGVSGESGYAGEHWVERHQWQVGLGRRQIEARLGRDGLMTVGDQSFHIDDGAVFLVDLDERGATLARQIDDDLEIAGLADPIKTLAARHQQAAAAVVVGQSERGDELFRHVECGRMSEVTARGLARVAQRMARLPANPLAARADYARALDDEQRQWMCALRELTLRDIVRPGLTERDITELLGLPSRRGESSLRWQFDSPRMVNPYLDAHVHMGAVRQLRTGIN